MKRLLLLLALLVATVATAGPAAAVGPPVLTTVSRAAAGGTHSCFVTTNHQVMCQGSNWDGEMGVGDYGYPEAPARWVLAPTGTARLGNVVEVVAGYYTTCARLTTGQVRCWGYADDGEIGNGVDADRALRAKVVSNPAGTGPLTDVVQLTAGERHVCALLANHQVRCWGDNEYGQLGAQVAAHALRPKVVRAVSGGGPLTGVTQIDAGYSSTCARLSTGQARCWGKNEWNLLGGNHPGHANEPRPVVVRSGNGQPLTGVAEVAVGRNNTCVRYANGHAACWGLGEHGANGNGTDDDHQHAVLVQSSANLAAITGVVEVDAGDGGACARRSNGQVWCWGIGLLVADGVGNASSRARGIQNATSDGYLVNAANLDVGQGHGCVATTGHRAFCWGLNTNEQVSGADVDPFTRSEPIYAPASG